MDRRLLIFSLIFVVALPNVVFPADYFRPTLPLDAAEEGIGNWEGGYVGIFAGQGVGTSTATEVQVLPNDPSSCAPSGTPGVPVGSYYCNLNGEPHYISTPTPSFNAVGDKWGMPLRGTVGGVTLGYNKQRGKLVYGVEADWGYFGLSGKSGPSPASVDDTTLHTAGSDFMTARMRVGYTMDRLMVFGTAGAALARFNSWVDDPDMAIGIQTQQTSTQPGVVIGAGAEYQLTDRISLKADYMHMRFMGSRVEGYVNITCTSDCPPQWKIDRAGMALDGIAAWDIGHTVDMARVGINMKF